MMGAISDRRREIYQYYRRQLKPLETEGLLQLPHTPEDCSANYHMFYVLTKDGPTRDALMQHLHKHGIGAVFHYVPLHSSPMGRRLGGNARELPITDSVSARLVRLPFYYTITDEEQAEVVRQIAAFYRCDVPATGRE
jgi:dTDP-4-amino-4,6-dideoxygalactose transaminase